MKQGVDVFLSRLFFQFNLQAPEKNLNYRTQLLHSHLRQPGSESSTHLKVNYNDLMPLVAGVHWKSPGKHSLQKKWEGERGFSPFKSFLLRVELARLSAFRRCV